MSSVNVIYDSGYSNSYAFEYWKDITVDSKELEFKQAVGENYDSEGFGIYNGRYVIACTETFGTIGDFLDFTLADGSILKCVMGDTKSNENDTPTSTWVPMGHIDYVNKVLNVVEFLVDYTTWGPGTGHDNPGTPTCHPEWAGFIQKCENTGNYWTGANTDTVSSAKLAYISCKRLFNGTQSYDAFYIGNAIGENVFFNDSEFYCYNTGTKQVSIKNYAGIDAYWCPTGQIYDVNVSTTDLKSLINSSTNGSATSSNYNVEQAVQWAVNKANSGNITYSLNPDTMWGPTSYNCSTFIISAFRAAGFSLANASYTGNMISAFEQEGFQWIAMSPSIPSSVLVRGDIMVNKTYHTQMYIGNNQDVNCGSTPARVMNHVSTYYLGEVGYGWDGYLHYVGKS